MQMRKNGLSWCTLVLLLSGFAGSAHGETWQSIQQRKPELFHPQTGLRIERQRAPVPDNIPPPAQVISADKVAGLQSKGAVLLDVFGALQSRYDELDGTWLVGKKRMSIPGAVWLPETGRGVLQPEMKTYLKENLTQLTKGNLTRPVIVFCVSDCWMSWNAARRIAEFGYTRVYWFPTGTDGWQEAGHKLEQVDPVPVRVD